LGSLEEKYLTTLREFGGLQSYPSRSKDPDPVDYSTGSVGIGATAPIWCQRQPKIGPFLPTENRATVCCFIVPESVA